MWFFHALSAEGLPAICIDARHAKAALNMAANKTDANDADGLAHLAEVGFYRAVRVKGLDSMLSRTLVAARTKLMRTTLDVANQIRGLMKTFGLIVPRSMGGTFEAHVRSLLADLAGLARIILPLLEAWRSLRILCGCRLRLPADDRRACRGLSPRQTCPAARRAPEVSEA